MSRNGTSRYPTAPRRLPKTPPEVAAAQKQLAMLQWAVPALTGALTAIEAYAAEQYRPEEVSRGLGRRLLPS